MVWVTITNKEPSKFNPHDYLVFFEYFGEENFAVITSKVLAYIDKSVLSVGDKIFVVKTTGKDNKERFFVRSCKKNV
ncbi:MAG: hypothetical protein ACOC1P_00325 [Minisyncoccales bacterium]